MKDLSVILINPRGFCAGVTRAIEIVNKTLEKFGKPVYVHHEIVHNRFVVEELKKKGAVFVEDLQTVPQDRPVIFSAHGVSKSVINEAKNRGLKFFDATCPLVNKIHLEVENNISNNIKTILIGHKNHAEVIGTKGQGGDDEIFVVSNTEDIDDLCLNPKEKVSYVTQTTLSVDETNALINHLKKRFINLKDKHKSNVCYATTNRQDAVKVLSQKCDTILVIGDPNSSNSKRLVEVAKSSGCKNSYLIQGKEELNLSTLQDIKVLGITAGASAPEILVKDVINKLKNNFNLNLTETTVSKEELKFKLPKELEG